MENRFNTTHEGGAPIGATATTPATYLELINNLRRSENFPSDISYNLAIKAADCIIDLAFKVQSLETRNNELIRLARRVSDG